jgi:hypothetical protein
MGECKLKSGANGYGALQQKGVRQMGILYCCTAHLPNRPPILVVSADTPSHQLQLVAFSLHPLLLMIYQD